MTLQAKILLDLIFSMGRFSIKLYKKQITREQFKLERLVKATIIFRFGKAASGKESRKHVPSTKKI